MRHKQTEEYKLSYFLSKAIFKTILKRGHSKSAFAQNAPIFDPPSPLVHICTLLAYLLPPKRIYFFVINHPSTLPSFPLKYKKLKFCRFPIVFKPILAYFFGKTYSKLAYLRTITKAFLNVDNRLTHPAWHNTNCDTFNWNTLAWLQLIETKIQRF